MRDFYVCPNHAATGGYESCCVCGGWDEDAERGRLCTEATDAGRCGRDVLGFRCTLPTGHEGPCVSTGVTPVGDDKDSAGDATGSVTAAPTSPADRGAGVATTGAPILPCHACGTPMPSCIDTPAPCCDECHHGGAIRHRSSEPFADRPERP